MAAEARWVTGPAGVAAEYVSAARAVPEQVRPVVSQQVALDQVVPRGRAEEVRHHRDSAGEYGWPGGDVVGDQVAAHPVVMGAHQRDAHPGQRGPFLALPTGASVPADRV